MRSYGPVDGRLARPVMGTTRLRKLCQRHWMLELDGETWLRSCQHGLWFLHWVWWMGKSMLETLVLPIAVRGSWRFSHHFWDLFFLKGRTLRYPKHFLQNLRCQLDHRWCCRTPGIVLSFADLNQGLIKIPGNKPSCTSV